MICQTCGARPAPAECGTVIDRVPYGEREVDCVSGMCCPVCGGEELSEAADCADCGGEFAACEITDGLCRMCEAQLKETLEWLCEQLSPAQKHWMQCHPAWMDAYT